MVCGRAGEAGKGMNALLDAIVFDVGGTLVTEAPPATPTGDLEVVLLPGVLDDLRHLAGRVRIGAATNTAVMTETDVRELLAPSGINELIDVLVTSCDVRAAKPDPAVLLAALERLGGLDPSRVLFVGDQASDAAAAHAASMPYAAVSPEGVRSTVETWVADGAGQRFT